MSISVDQEAVIRQRGGSSTSLRHSKGVLHREKPGHVLICEWSSCSGARGGSTSNGRQVGNLRVLDCGLARLTGAGPGIQGLVAEVRRTEEDLTFRSADLEDQIGEGQVQDRRVPGGLPERGLLHPGHEPVADLDLAPQQSDVHVDHVAVGREAGVPDVLADPRATAR